MYGYCVSNYAIFHLIYCFSRYLKLSAFSKFSVSLSVCLCCDQLLDLLRHVGCNAMFQKLWFQHVWPCLQQEMKTQEVLAAVLEPVISLVQECTSEEYESIILSSFRYATCAFVCTAQIPLVHGWYVPSLSTT